MNEKKEVEEALQQCLEMVLSGEATIDSALSQFPGLAKVLRPKLESALWLQANRDAVGSRPRFVVTSRRRLVDQIKQEQTEAKRKAPTFVGPKQIVHLAVALVLILAIFLSSTGVVSAASSSLPGDQLYPVKIALEKGRLLLSFSDSQDIQLHIQFAQYRLDEIAALVSSGNYNDLNLAFENHQYHIEEAGTGIASLAESYSTEARELALIMTETLAQEDQIIRALLVDDIPDETRLMVADTFDVLNSTQSLMMAIFGNMPALEVSETIVPSRTFIPTPSMEDNDVLELGKTPKPTHIPRLTHTPKPTNTKKLTHTPRPTHTPKPTDEEKPTRTPRPTHTPKPTNTKKPTHTPRPTNTHKPTQKPTQGN